MAYYICPLLTVLFWDAPRSGSPHSQPVLDAAFVDDEALVLVAQTPCAFDSAVDALLKTLLMVFDCLHLQLNANQKERGVAAVP